MMKGHVAFWDSERGFGVLVPRHIPDGPLTIVTAMFAAAGMPAPHVGDWIHFDIVARKSGWIEPTNLRSAAPEATDSRCAERWPPAVASPAAIAPPRWSDK